MRSDRYADEDVRTESVDSYDSSEEEYFEEAESNVEEDDQPKRKGLFGRKNKAEAVSEETPDLARMKKKELLEIMLAQGKEIDSLRARVEELEAELANRQFEFDKIGSIAEASLAVTNIFKEAEKAAKIYLDNIRRSYEERSKDHGSY